MANVIWGQFRHWISGRRKRQSSWMLPVHCQHSHIDQRKALIIPMIPFIIPMSPGHCVLVNNTHSVRTPFESHKFSKGFLSSLYSKVKKKISTFKCEIKRF